MQELNLLKNCGSKTPHYMVGGWGGMEKERKPVQPMYRYSQCLIVLFWKLVFRGKKDEIGNFS